jgi:hypothetical protein
MKWLRQDKVHGEERAECEISAVVSVVQLEIAHAFYESVVFIYADHLSVIDIGVGVESASGSVESDDDNYCRINDQAHKTGPQI